MTIDDKVVGVFLFFLSFFGLLLMLAGSNDMGLGPRKTTAQEHSDDIGFTVLGVVILTPGLLHFDCGVVPLMVVWWYSICRIAVLCRAMTQRTGRHP